MLIAGHLLSLSSPKSVSVYVPPVQGAHDGKTTVFSDSFGGGTRGGIVVRYGDDCRQTCAATGIVEGGQQQQVLSGVGVEENPSGTGRKTSRRMKNAINGF